MTFLVHVPTPPVWIPPHKKLIVPAIFYQPSISTIKRGGNQLVAASVCVSFHLLKKSHKIWEMTVSLPLSFLHTSQSASRLVVHRSAHPPSSGFSALSPLIYSERGDFVCCPTEPTICGFAFACAEKLRQVQRFKSQPRKTRLLKCSSAAISQWNIMNREGEVVARAGCRFTSKLRRSSLQWLNYCTMCMKLPWLMQTANQTSASAPVKTGLETS